MWKNDLEDFVNMLDKVYINNLNTFILDGRTRRKGAISDVQKGPEGQAAEIIKENGKKNFCDGQ